MDEKTPPIPLKHQERKEQHQRKEDKSPEPVSLPPLTPLPNGNRQPQQQHQRSKNSDPGAPWTRGPPYVSRNCDHRRRRPYRVLHIGATPLMHACQQADRSRVLRLLKEQEETVGYRDRTLRSALHYCMDAGTGGAVASAAPELVNAPDAEGHTPLHLAVIAGDTQLVAVLLANGADVNAKDLEGHSVLHWATVCGEAECVRLVLAAGASPSTPDLRGGSPLHYAAQCCGAAVTAELAVPKKIGLKVLQTLLEFGADVNAKDEDGRQPILWAASAGSVEAVLALARAGGSAAAGATDKDGLTALHCAASRGHARCVEALVNLCGCHPDHVDDNGCSALHYAATLGHADATALLLRLGADPNRQDRKGRTPALCAAAKGQLETLKILAQHGGSLHARTVRGTGVAHEAVISGRIELIEWLAKKRPSTLDVATHDGKTPLHVAALNGYLDVCKVLLDHGTRINAILRTSKSGPMTALDAALYRGHRDCAKLVQMHGGTTARHLRTHKTAPNRVFAAKLRVKRGDTSTESESSSGRRIHCRREPDLYFEERWIEKRTRRRGAGGPRKSSTNRRGSRSLSEEEIRLGKLSRCRGDRGRRARSESSRYEACRGHERSEGKVCSKKCEKAHEYGESSSDTNVNSENEKDVTDKCARTRVNAKAERTKKCGKEKRSSGDESVTVLESEDDERSLSDDSLEVVVVKKSLEKTSEKVQISGKTLKTPRKTSTETRVTETRRSRKKSKNRRIRTKVNEDDDDDDDDDPEKLMRGPKKRGIDEGVTEQNGDAKEARKMTERKSKRKNNEDGQFRKDATDSTSQENVERVIVTALVHKDQAPDTPKGSNEARTGGVATAKREKEMAEMKGKIETRASSVRSEMDEILEKADELQSALLTKAADLRKDVEDIRRQMGSDSSQNVEHDATTVAHESEENPDVFEVSDDPVTVKRKRNDEGISAETTSDSQIESSRLQSQRDVETSTETSANVDKVGSDEANESKESAEKSLKTLRSEENDGATEESVKSLIDDDNSASKDGKEEETDAENCQSPASIDDHKFSRSNRESTSSAIEEKATSERTPDPSASGRVEDGEEKSEESRDKIDKLTSVEETSRDKAFEKLPDKTIDSPKVKASENRDDDDSEKIIENEGQELQTVGSGKFRFIDRSSSGSAKSSRLESRSRPSTGRNRGLDSGRSTSKSPSKSRSLFESSEERSPDRSAIVAVIESPEWDEEDDEEIEKEIRDVVGVDAEDPETETEDGTGVLRVLPSTSEEETPRIGGKLLRTKTDSLPMVDGRPRAKRDDTESPTGLRDTRGGRAKQRRDSGGRDSGIEPSPRVSKIPKRTTKYCPNTEKQRALNMETVTRDVQISLRRYHLERKIFFQLMELKRLQIRHGRANEHVLVKRQVETFHKAGMSGPTLGVAKYDQPLTFRHFEAFLYEQLRRLQRRPVTPDFCTEAKQCTQKTHRCHHATSAYTSVPVYTYRRR